MSREQGGAPGNHAGNSVARGAGFAAAKGALLIGFAVILGVYLLQRIDTGNTGPADRVAAKATTSTTTTTRTTKTTKSTATTAAKPKTPDQLHLVVLNGGAASGQAGKMHDALRAKGYTNIDPANNWAGHVQKGNSVLCRAGLSQEAAALSVAVGQGTRIEAFPASPPPFSDQADCVVVVGS